MFFRSLRRGRRPPGLGFATALPVPECLLADLLHPGDRLLRTLPGPGVGPGALASDGEAAAVADAGVTADLNLPLDVLGHLPAEVAFHLEVGVDPRPQPRDLFLGEVPDAGVG